MYKVVGGNGVSLALPPLALRSPPASGAILSFLIGGRFRSSSCSSFSSRCRVLTLASVTLSSSVIGVIGHAARAARLSWSSSPVLVLGLLPCRRRSCGECPRLAAPTWVRDIKAGVFITHADTLSAKTENGKPPHTSVGLPIGFATGRHNSRELRCSMHLATGRATTATLRCAPPARRVFSCCWWCTRCLGHQLGAAWVT